MARKVGQIIARGDRRWLIRVYLGRDHETNKRNYHNQTIRGSMREAQSYLTRKLRERDLGRDLEGAKITLSEYLDRWLETAVRPRVRPKTFQDYQGMLHRYVRPILGERVLAGLRPLDLQTMYQQMTERGLSARTVRYAHVVVKSGMQQAVRWRLLLENPADGLKVPQQQRNEMRSLAVDQARTLLKAVEGTKYGPVLAVALTTGMRPSEYLGLKWQDIDWARQTISIVRSIQRLNGKWCFSDTKRSRSRRPIKLQTDKLHQRETGLQSRACACSPQANQLGGGLNQLRRIETHAIFEDQLNLLHVFNLLRRVVAQHHQIGGFARRNRSDARISAHVDCPIQCGNADRFDR